MGASPCSPAFLSEAGAVNKGSQARRRHRADAVGPSLDSHPSARLEEVVTSIVKTRGDLDGAEKMYRKALEIDEQLERFERTAIQYRHLGAIFQKRGDLEEAHQLWTQARDLYEQMGI